MNVSVLLQDILYAAAPLVALTNPLTELPIFLQIVEGRSRREGVRAAWRAAFAVFLILTISAVGGLRLLDLLGINFSSFRAAGGLLLIVMGMEMLLGRETTLQRTERGVDDPDDAIWVPLVMPMLAGPGAIAATVGLTVRDNHYVGWFPVATLVAIVVCAAVVFVVLASAAPIARHLPRRTLGIVTRFSGLILVAIGFQMGLTGVAEFFVQAP